MSEIRNEMYLQLHGYKPIKRARPKEGESKWYYLDPRGTDNISEMKTIDVSSQYVPNPKIIEIVKDDMKRHEEDYYIWRTEGDDKVRDAHAAREGHIYNWHIPPEGGHPGEDYNCRCWAEPYKPHEDEVKKGEIVELTGENGGILSDEELYDRMWENIKEFEKIEKYPYLDSKGFITIGAGANVNNLDDFLKLNLTVNGLPATIEEKIIAYERLRQLSKEKDDQGHYVNRNKRASAFEEITNVRISEREAYQIAKRHMLKDLAHLRKEFADFDGFPLPLKEVLLDIQYNVIGGINERSWPKLYKAIREKKVFGEDGIAVNVSRKDIGNKRNDWAKRTARSIRF